VTNLHDLQNKLNLKTTSFYLSEFTDLTVFLERVYIVCYYLNERLLHPWAKRAEWYFKKFSIRKWSVL